jgi:hypothetical protein
VVDGERRHAERQGELIPHGHGKRAAAEHIEAPVVHHHACKLWMHDHRNEKETLKVVYCANDRAGQLGEMVTPRHIDTVKELLLVGRCGAYATMWL